MNFLKLHKNVLIHILSYIIDDWYLVLIHVCSRFRNVIKQTPILNKDFVTLSKSNIRRWILCNNVSCCSSVIEWFIDKFGYHQMDSVGHRGCDLYQWIVVHQNLNILKMIHQKKPNLDISVAEGGMCCAIALNYHEMIQWYIKDFQLFKKMLQNCKHICDLRIFHLVIKTCFMNRRLDLINQILMSIKSRFPWQNPLLSDVDYNEKQAILWNYMLGPAHSIDNIMALIIKRKRTCRINCNIKQHIFKLNGEPQKLSIKYLSKVQKMINAKFVNEKCLKYLIRNQEIDILNFLITNSTKFQIDLNFIKTHSLLTNKKNMINWMNKTIGIKSESDFSLLGNIIEDEGCKSQTFFWFVERIEVDQRKLWNIFFYHKGAIIKRFKIFQWFYQRFDENDKEKLFNLVKGKATFGNVKIMKFLIAHGFSPSSSTFFLHKPKTNLFLLKQYNVPVDYKIISGMVLMSFIKQHFDVFDWLTSNYDLFIFHQELINLCIIYLGVPCKQFDRGDLRSDQPKSIWQYLGIASCLYYPRACRCLCENLEHKTMSFIVWFINWFHINKTFDECQTMMNYFSTKVSEIHGEWNLVHFLAIVVPSQFPQFPKINYDKFDQTIYSEWLSNKIR